MIFHKSNLYVTGKMVIGYEKVGNNCSKVHFKIAEITLSVTVATGDVLQIPGKKSSL